MMNTLDFSVILERWPELLQGTIATLGLALAGMALAMVIGVLGVAIRRSGNRLGAAIVVGFVEIIRNTPFLVQIFFIFFALPLAGVRLNPTTTSIIALGLNGGAYAIEIIRGGVESIPRGQTEAGMALGLHQGEIFRIIILRPALRAIYPSLCSQFILLTLTTSICTSISAFELTQVAQRIDGDTFRSFEVYFTVTAIYLVLSWMIMGLLAFIGSRAFSYPTR
ncbi:ABC transporter permease subunit [Paracoccus limosus]|uniref:ABC transporter permease subunit n=1 Tax=Paracoccus limosus TaxID=913252 RepID=A0A844HBE3_9RHOB|nr:amino acid ABC transporter permease [Paracoccus limosus]MTH36528.1 ABC transporter permease subunit [Paracoccus limosus]